MGMFSLKKIVKMIAVMDVLVATGLITTYVYLLASHLHELQLLEGSKRTQILLYIYVATTNVIQMLVAFQYYQTLTNPKETDDEVEDVLRMSKFWMVVSYVLMINWIIKTGVYAQTRHRLSAAIVLCVVEVTFRVVAACVVKVYIMRLSRIVGLKSTPVNKNVFAN